MSISLSVWRQRELFSKAINLGTEYPECKGTFPLTLQLEISYHTQFDTTKNLKALQKQINNGFLDQAVTDKNQMTIKIESY